MPAVDSDGFAWYALPDGEPNWRYLTEDEIIAIFRARNQYPGPVLYMENWHYGPIEPKA